MGKDSKIGWTTHTFNAWWGCVEVSPECDHCYARTWAKRCGFEIWGKTADRRFFGEKHWAELYRWNREAAAKGRMARVFWNSMSDICEDRRDLDPWRALAWTSMIMTPHLIHLLLTKRPQNYRRMFPLEAPRWATVHFGATVGCRDSLWRIDELRNTIAAREHRFVSAEPLLEDLGEIDLRDIGLVIIGGESGGGARSMNFEWARNIARQARRDGCKIFVKQAGAKPTDGLTQIVVTDRNGEDIRQFPKDMRVRQL
jgi:protein gp37